MAAYGAKLGLDYETAVKIGSAFGGGMGKTGEVCGAVTGALMIIGLKYGSADAGGSKAKTYNIAEQFIKEFRARHNTIICRELLGFEIGLKKDLDPAERMIISERCPGYVKAAADILEGII